MYVGIKVGIWILTFLNLKNPRAGVQDSSAAHSDPVKTEMVNQQQLK